MGSRTSSIDATEMLRDAAVTVTQKENEIRQNRNRKGTRKTNKKFN